MYNSAHLKFADGTLVPKATDAMYLGVNLSKIAHVQSKLANESQPCSPRGKLGWGVKLGDSTVIST